ncbi:hypothetical protein BT63DRAFT_426268 [Microthyrium microscopicum]|uniref:Tetratricopeptide repeat domain-containing protein n=1 Tax=Microthyrium microscopicum TaxID=703497 RepID=A0A6A6U5G0_9PEZI|nr:hypothetical protein BT63DRAFT_426268 [Microthyrium microscopicum]
MVFPKAVFARLTLGKSISHGYAQSVVAASHTWSASQTLQNRFQKPFSHNALLANNVNSSKSRDGHNDFGLVEYLKEWQKHQKLGANWAQYQFAKRIEWSPHTLSAENKDDLELEGKSSEELQQSAARTPASFQDSAVSDLSEGARDDALAKLDEALADVAQEQKDVDSAIGDAHEVVFNEHTSDIFEAVSPESQAFADQLTKLASEKQYADIPAVFESMLNSGIAPTAKAYNSLLLAAIHLPRGRHEAVSKTLNVYADMLQRQVLPDVTTYTIMIDFLARRSLSVLSMRSALEDKRARYGRFDQGGKYLFQSSETEEQIIAQDDSLSIALRLFDAASSVYPDEFTERTFRVLVSACAEQNRIPEMVNVYSQMTKQQLVPSAEIFVSMMGAFARANDITNAVSIYKAYKDLAILNNDGALEMIRKDNDIYAALIKAYITADKLDIADEMMGKLQATAPSSDYFVVLQDTVGLKGFLAEWLKSGKVVEAFSHVEEKLSPLAKDVGYAAVCIRSADRNIVETATKAFSAISDKADISEPAFAMSAMEIRNSNLPQAETYWSIVEQAPIKMELLEMTTMYAVAMIGSGHAHLAIQRLRSAFARIRARFGQESDILGKVDESINVVSQYMQHNRIMLPVATSMQLVSAMLENHGAIPSVAVHLLAGFGSAEVSQLSLTDLQTVMQVQASVILGSDSYDIASDQRFGHILELLTATGVEPAQQTKEAIEAVLVKLDRPELFARWNARHAVREPMYSPVAFTPFPGTPVSAQASFEDSTDPYFATTDNKGSSLITDLLEKPHGKYNSQLNEAMSRFKTMRRSGRHPRFFTYAKLIAAAAKDNKLNVAHEVLGLARQDVPYLPQYRVVRYGWVSILDAMVAACLQSGNRQQAHQFHQELLSMGAAPTSNTFGLYITTLKESTKTFDEASEAVKIFLQAKAEGVEPTSFLYNALIGKLGKARRIDDCLFYFQEMRTLGIQPTSVTYGTIVNALCRVSDEKFAEELFEEMESMPNYKPRPAPYHSMMQFFLTTKRDRAKVLAYYERMRARAIPPTAHTFKLLIDAHASLDPVDAVAAEAVLAHIAAAGMHADAVHYAALIHAKGCVTHDLPAARALFDRVISDRQVRPQPCLYQALFESMVANHAVADSDAVLADMTKRGVELTPYIANALIHGWALEGRVDRAEAIFARVSRDRREPSTYEAMTRAYVIADMRDKAMGVVNEALARGYPAAVAGKIVDLVGRPAEVSA